jgi:hypothetical protein
MYWRFNSSLNARLWLIGCGAMVAIVGLFDVRMRFTRLMFYLICSLQKGHLGFALLE